MRGTPKRLPNKVESGKPVRRCVDKVTLQIRVVYASGRAQTTIRRYGMFVPEKKVAYVTARIDQVEWFDNQGGRMAIIHIKAPIGTIQLIYFEKGSRIYHWRDFA